MNEKTEIEIKRLIELNNVTKTSSIIIEEIADRFPGEYSTEREYIEFQQEIAELAL